MGSKSSSSSLDLEMKNSKKKKFEDRISCCVPDEILVSIVSKLSIKEAGRTSILSHRWEKVWICYQGNLEFDATNRLKRAPIYDCPQMKLDQLISMNQVLRPMLHQLGSPLDSLVLRFHYFDIETHHKPLIDVIVQFLMSRRSIRILEFDMNPMGDIADFFSFPVQFYVWIKQPSGGLNTISALTSLSFNCISVSNDTVLYFLANCPLLERLSVQRSDLLSNLRIIGDASLRLKYLKIKDFRELKSLVVSAPNLVSLDYQGYNEIKLDVSNLPKLAEVCLGKHIMTYMSGSLSTYLAQILTLNLSFFANKLFNTIIPNNVVFSNLKHLVLTVIIEAEEYSLLGFTSSLVEASPMLEKFTLEPLNCVPDNEVGLHMINTMTSNTKRYSHQRLKVVELTKFLGVTPEVELLIYFVENFGSLERIIIDTSKTFTTDTPDEKRRYHERVTKERARRRMKHIPPGIDFVLI